MKKVLLLTIIFLSVINVGYSEDSIKKLTVDEAVILAADNNISLQRQRISLNTLEKKKNTSWNGISPSLSASGSASIPFEDGDISYSISGSVGLSFTPSLFTSIKSAKLNYENGVTSYENAVRTIELNVRKIFCSLLYSKENIELQQRKMETAKSLYESNLAKYNRGQLSELDLLNSQYSYESVIPTLQSLQNSYENSIATFKQTLGLSQDVQIELVGNIEEYLNIGKIEINKSIEEVPAVKTILANIELAKTSLLATRFSAWGPSLSASYSYGKAGTSASSDLRTTGNSLSLSLRLPLDGFLPWSNGALSIANQKANLQDLELQLKEKKESVALEIQNNIKNIEQAQAQLKVLESNVQLAQKRYNMTLTAYNHGSKDLLTLQNASDALMTARDNLSSQKIKIFSAILDLENTLGVPFGTLGKEEN
ncbi:MAG: TolC family protein [Treponema bryantii]|nr:TolC family protein [Treponema bryantii]